MDLQAPAKIMKSLSVESWAGKCKDFETSGPARRVRGAADPAKSPGINPPGLNIRTQQVTPQRRNPINPQAAGFFATAFFSITLCAGAFFTTFLCVAFFSTTLCSGALCAMVFSGAFAAAAGTSVAKAAVAVRKDRAAVRAIIFFMGNLSSKGGSSSRIQRCRLSTAIRHKHKSCHIAMCMFFSQNRGKRSIAKAILRHLPATEHDGFMTIF
ncbi:hypothetical protein AFE_2958 [Acidithiobacillus ferrooxidans ATCC 23270]|uniref:Uncharacterized protein n=1 Tax=Acidithiobacillus ferrooxidans (strain ATCC 23270 / DSM 14882 / CIP 104768 / NCIMB 8455) TaxID=243159 RepID=B7J9T1_ACIF2|nr:hypothetical protein AFE_2958 [Acidithiobacillus ferrooxidans ATCC 23270]